MIDFKPTVVIGGLNSGLCGSDSASTCVEISSTYGACVNATMPQFPNFTLLRTARGL